ncbi:MAG: helix-turn-helix domain-containing protein [Elusimicrobia bacterium]|nr:helix-turn-helix domain-containing protein [Elusimicrobiota bacterium]
MTLEQEPDPLRRIPTKHATAARAEIGAILRAARLKRGQSLETVAQQTRISKRFLEALEENRFETFPAVVYLRGFLKGYCEHLEVGFEEIWSMLDSAPPAAEPPAAGPAPKDSPPPAPARGHDAPAPQAPHAAARPHGSGAAGAIALSVALALGLGIYLFKEQSETASPPAAAAPAALQPMPRSIEPSLIVRLNDDAWLRVSMDGAVVFEGRAPRGAVQEWKPSKFVELRTTAPAALELSLNGQPAPLGDPGPDGQYRVEIP